MIIVGCVLFILLFAVALWYCSNLLLYALWNSKGAIKARKEAIEALISVEKWLQENRGDCNG